MVSSVNDPLAYVEEEELMKTENKAAAGIVSSESSEEELNTSPFKIVERRVNDAKMFFTMSCAVCYVFSMTVVCVYYTSNSEAFTGQTKSEIGCYARDDSDIPTTMKDPLATDIVDRFKSTILYGTMVHFLGILGDSSFAIRVYVTKTQWYRLASLILVSFYTLLWLGWLIWLHVVVFTHGGKVCKGSYLSDEPEVQAGYAIQQGQILTNILIGVWCANGAIAVLSIIAGVVAAQYLKRKK